MPTYLCHGFRWHRKSIRVYIIVQNLDDASPEWIIPAKSSRCILESFYELFDFLPYCKQTSPSRVQLQQETAITPAWDTDSDCDGRTLVNTEACSVASRYCNRGRSRSRSRSHSRSTYRHGRGVSRAHYPQEPVPPLPTQNPSLPSGCSPEPGTPESNCDISGESPTDSDGNDEQDDFATQSWSAVKLLEEYDPRDLSCVSRPWAYVADYVVRIDTSCSLAEEIAKYEREYRHKNGWIEDLRDELQRGEQVQWFVVVNGDEERGWKSSGRGCETERNGGTPGADCEEICQKLKNECQPENWRYKLRCLDGYQQAYRSTASKAQRHHHAQYLLQQEIFESEERRLQHEQHQAQYQQQVQQLHEKCLQGKLRQYQHQRQHTHQCYQSQPQHRCCNHNQHQPCHEKQHSCSSNHQRGPSVPGPPARAPPPVPQAEDRPPTPPPRASSRAQTPYKSQQQQQLQQPQQPSHNRTSSKPKIPDKNYLPPLPIPVPPIPANINNNAANVSINGKNETYPIRLRHKMSFDTPRTVVVSGGMKEEDIARPKTPGSSSMNGRSLRAHGSVSGAGGGLKKFFSREGAKVGDVTVG